MLSAARRKRRAPSIDARPSTLGCNCGGLENGFHALQSCRPGLIMRDSHSSSGSGCSILKRAAQDALLYSYRCVQRSGVLRTSLGRWLFLRAYWTYKSFWEPDMGYLRQCVPPASRIIDEGANVGFFTYRFCGWVSGGGRVLAFEPAQENFEALLNMSRRFGHEEVLLARRALLADADTTMYLALNADNPADRRIGMSGVPTPAMRLDTVMGELGWPAVGLIKIDVQGAECMVLGGAAQTIRRSRPALFIEVDDRALRRFGSTAAELPQMLLATGYQMHEARAGALETPIHAARAASLMDRLGYADFVFLPEPLAPTR